MNKLINIMNLDKEIANLKKNLEDKNFDWSKKKKELEKIISTGNYESERGYLLDVIKKEYGSKKDINILDFGCGSGIYVTILLLMGYKNVRGFDVFKKFSNEVIKNLNFSEQTFELTDGKLPYPDKTFDFINSSQVLEHVEDIDLYYREAARVLKDDGICFFSFPHRLQIYDTHSRTFFIHWFPKFLRKILYNIFSRSGGESLNNYLFLKSLAHHKKISNKYFSVFMNISSHRLKNLDKKNYKGKLALRNFAHKLMNIKFFGKMFVNFFSFFSSADIFLKK